MFDSLDILQASQISLNHPPNFKQDLTRTSLHYETLYYSHDMLTVSSCIIIVFVFFTFSLFSILPFLCLFCNLSTFISAHPSTQPHIHTFRLSGTRSSRFIYYYLSHPLFVQEIFLKICQQEGSRDCNNSKLKQSDKYSVNIISTGLKQINK